MLVHEAQGPDAVGEFQVTYQTPGCNVPTVACSGMRSRGAADTEAKRLNDAQLNRERVIQADAIARGLRTIHPDLEQQ